MKTMFSLIHKAQAAVGGGNSRGRRYLRRHPEFANQPSDQPKVSKPERRAIANAQKVVKAAEQLPVSPLPPNPTSLDAPPVLVLTPSRPETAPEVMPASCACANGYRAAARPVIPNAPKKLGFFKGIGQKVGRSFDKLCTFSTRSGGGRNS